MSVVSASKCAEMFEIPKECKTSFEMMEDMDESLDPVCQDWAVDHVQLDDKAKFRALQCLLGNFSFINYIAISKCLIRKIQS